jgi:hypothetical protein
LFCSTGVQTTKNIKRLSIYERKINCNGGSSYISSSCTRELGSGSRVLKEGGGLDLFPGRRFGILAFRLFVL